MKMCLNHLDLSPTKIAKMSGDFRYPCKKLPCHTTKTSFGVNCRSPSEGLETQFSSLAIKPGTQEDATFLKLAPSKYMVNGLTLRCKLNNFRFQPTPDIKRSSRSRKRVRRSTWWSTIRTRTMLDPRWSKRFMRRGTLCTSQRTVNPTSLRTKHL